MNDAQTVYDQILRALDSTVVKAMSEGSGESVPVEPLSPTGPQSIGMEEGGPYPGLDGAVEGEPGGQGAEMAGSSAGTNTYDPSKPGMRKGETETMNMRATHVIDKAQAYAYWSTQKNPFVHLAQDASGNIQSIEPARALIEIYEDNSEYGAESIAKSYAENSAPPEQRPGLFRSPQFLYIPNREEE